MQNTVTISLQEYNELLEMKNNLNKSKIKIQTKHLYGGVEDLIRCGRNPITLYEYSIYFGDNVENNVIDHFNEMKKIIEESPKIFYSEKLERQPIEKRPNFMQYIKNYFKQEEHGKKNQPKN
jgi:hypothetical protein